jgi:hypothetical protein
MLDSLKTTRITQTYILIGTYKCFLKTGYVVLKYVECMRLKCKKKYKKKYICYQQYG